MTLKAKTPHPLLDEVRRIEKLRNDAALAEHIGISRAVISSIRTGNAMMSDGVRVAIMRHCKMSMRRVDELSPPPKQVLK